MSLQRREDDGTWATLDERRASRLRDTRIDLPQDAAASPAAFRVVFTPKNTDINAWVSEDVRA